MVCSTVGGGCLREDRCGYADTPPCATMIRYHDTMIRSVVPLFAGGRQMCVEGPGSLVAGWFDSGTVMFSSGEQASYPQGNPQCCTPALLLASGDVWELERCFCQQLTGGTSCGHPASHQLLQGFSNSECVPPYAPYAFA